MKRMIVCCGTGTGIGIDPRLAELGSLLCKEAAANPVVSPLGVGVASSGLVDGMEGVGDEDEGMIPSPPTMTTPTQPILIGGGGGGGSGQVVGRFTVTPTNFQ
jgi:hypothetical protein